MSARTIYDEAHDLYDLSAVLAMDVTAQLVMNRRGDALTASRAVTQMESAKNLLDTISASDIGGIELPERQFDAAGCGEAVEAMLADEGLRSQMRLANLDAIEDVLDEVGAGQEFYSALEDMRADAAGK